MKLIKSYKLLKKTIILKKSFRKFREFFLNFKESAAEKFLRNLILRKFSIFTNKSDLWPKMAFDRQKYARKAQLVPQNSRVKFYDTISKIAEKISKANTNL